MKILYLITRLDSIGGAQVHVRDLARALVDLGHEVHIAGGATGPLDSSFAATGAKVHKIPELGRRIALFDDLGAVRRIKNLVVELEPDIVSFHSSKAGIVGRLATKSLPVSTVFTAHGWSFTEGVSPIRRLLYSSIERMAAHFVDRIVTVSDYDLELARRACIGKPHQLSRIHNGMPDLPSGFLAVRRQNQVPRITMVARFQEQKNHLALVRALSELRDLSWRLSFVGDGPLLGIVRDVVLEYGIEDRVEFLGQSYNVAEVLSASDIFVLSSHWEGFPRSILEAMRAGLPVVATDVGGCKESVVHGETGFLVSPGESIGLISALQKLIVDGELREAMGERGRSRFTASFRFERMLEETLELYSALRAPAAK